MKPLPRPSHEGDRPCGTVVELSIDSALLRGIREKAGGRAAEMVLARFAELVAAKSSGNAAFPAAPWRGR